MTIEVLIEIKAKQVDKTFTYSVPNELIPKVEIGKRVEVPFSNRVLEGFILKINDKNVTYEVKDIISIIDEDQVLNQEMLDLGIYVKQKTMSTLSSAYQSMLPTALKTKIGRDISIKKQKVLKIINTNVNLTEIQKEFLDSFSDGILTKTEALKISSSIPNTLIKKGVLVEYEEEVYRLKESIIKKENRVTLNEKQKEIVDIILNHKNTFHPFLLHGVTGSGKTEVYMNVIENILSEGKEVIVLVPEISLTPQIIEKFRSRFQTNIAILHSRLSDGEKYDEWRKICRMEVKIVIGARSAIFAPFTNLGAIIIDEEHSLTYKQENNPKYSAIDVAIRRAKTHNAPLILGSATPSIESYTRAKMGIYELLEIKKRINNTPPDIFLVDMREELKKKNKIFSEMLLNKIKERLEKKEQVILFLNRRGFSTVLECSDCGYVFKCPNCDIPLTFHKYKNTLKCHYCDYHEYSFKTCPSCKSFKIDYHGIGTEKVEEEINKLFPNAKTIRMDIDTTSKKGSHERIISSFENREADILIGTQMISKGLDFANVSLVGVINGDASLNIPDFRSAERTFQILNQVSGRSGRSTIKGEVVIQTFNKDHYSIVCALNNDYDIFYQKEMEVRKQLDYPPFFDLVLIKIKSPNYDEAHTEGVKIAAMLKNKDSIILGPTSAMIPRINNIYNLQIIIKCKKVDAIKKDLEYINNLYMNKKVKIDIEFNPLKI